MIERYFRLTENQTTVRREFLGGVTTFITMAYIVVVNPQILAQAGMPVEGVVFATCVASAAATLVMGLYANYPIALAPGMSLNAYFTYSVCLGMHVRWQTALGVIFLCGSPWLIRAGVQLWEADHAFSAYMDALVHKDWSRAYALCGPEFQAATTYNTFADKQSEVSARLGELLSYQRESSEAMSTRVGWSAVVHARLTYSKGSAEFVYELRKDKNRWSVWAYERR